jgi:A/G-specific adenine glycosylase
MSAQRVTSSVEAKPCLAKVSARKPVASSESRRMGRGLFTAKGSARSVAMTLAATGVAKKVGRTRAIAGVDDSVPDPAALLRWYDRHHRKLPWRATPGERMDAYRVWLSEIMLQQTTVKAVGPYYMRFLSRWPDVRALAAVKLDDVLKAWAGLGYYARARNLHACAIAVVDRHGGYFPDNEQRLRTLPGIGAYTAAAIAAIAFDRRAIAIDGNIERVIARLFAIETPLPAAKREVRERAEALLPTRRFGDFTQALMDLGATICTPKKPACGICPWMQACAARERGDAESLPHKAPKLEGKMRYGASFVVTRADGQVLVRSRPSNGLLGGMTEVPSIAWTQGWDEDMALMQAPLKARWRKLSGLVEHGFTHFPLRQTVYVARVPARTAAPDGMRWVPLADLHGEALPNIMRKVLAHAGLAPAPR